MASIIDICNLALATIGQQTTISSINPPDGSAAAQVAALFYQPKINALFRAANWNFARKQVELTLLRSAIPTTSTSTVSASDRPPQPWLFEYLYPPDAIRVRFIPQTCPNNYGVAVPTTTAQPIQTLPIWNNTPARFVIANTTDDNGSQIKTILTNQALAQCVYTCRVDDPNLWDPHFYDAATAMLAAWFVNALARNRGLMQDQINIANAIIAEARRTDGDEGLTSADHLPDWIQVRYASLGNWGWLYGENNCLWDAFAWPNGSCF